MQNTQDITVVIDPEFNSISVSGKTKPVPHLVLILHGIRSVSSRWMDLNVFNGKFEDLEIIPKPISYRYMSVTDLILGRGRDIRAKEVEVRINKVFSALNGNYAQVSIVCHSNGTKVFVDLSNEMKSKFDWVFFAGSICHLDDDKKFLNHNYNIINDCGTKDIYPIIAASLRPKIFGHTGVVGFNNPPFLDRFFEYGHFRALSVKHFEDWIIPILRTGEIPSSDCKCPKEKVHTPHIIRKFMIVTIFLLIMILAYIII